MIDRRNTDITAFVHENVAELQGDCIVGARTKIWQGVSIVRNSIIGADCVIGPGALIDGSVLGNGCHVQHNAFIDPGIVIGNDVFVGPGVKLCNDPWPRVSKAGWYDIQELVRRDFIVTEVRDGASLGAGG